MSCLHSVVCLSRQPLTAWRQTAHSDSGKQPRGAHHSATACCIALVWGWGAQGVGTEENISLLGEPP